MSPRYRVVAVLLALAAAPAPAFAQEGGDLHLRLRLEPGQSYRMSTVTQTDASQTVMGQEQQSHQSNEMVILSEVMAVDADGVTRVRFTYESIRVVQEGPMGRMEYDSNDSERQAPQGMRPFAFLLGKSFTMHFASDGSISDVEGFDDLLPRMLDDMDLPPGPMRDQVQQGLGDQFSGDAVAQMMRHATPAFPAEAVGVGDSWTRSLELERPMPLTAETTWTLRERRDGVAYLDMKTATVSAGSIDMAQMVMTTDMSGEITGTMEVDEATGLAIRAHMEDESSGTMTVSGGPMGDMIMPMTTRTVTTSELIPRR